MAPVSSGGKARRAAASKARDRGLQELGRSYKKGLLKIKRAKGSSLGGGRATKGRMQKRIGGEKAGRDVTGML